MSFLVAGAYDRFMGRYSAPLAAELVDWLAVAEGSRALDVGCGPGALTEVLENRLGSDRVAAVDPSAPFVEACRARHPDVDVRQASADALPFEDDSFDVTAANLVVHFMPDPVAGITEMARVTRPGCWVGATVWDVEGRRAPMAPVWRHLDRLAPNADNVAGAPAGAVSGIDLALTAAGLSDVSVAELAVTVQHPNFDEWWTPYLQGVGPIGEAIASLDENTRDELAARLRADLGEGPFEIAAVAFAARGRA